MTKKKYLEYLAKVYNACMLGDNIVWYDGEVYMHPSWCFDDNYISMTQHGENSTCTIVFYEKGVATSYKGIKDRLKVLKEVQL